MDRDFYTDKMQGIYRLLNSRWKLSVGLVCFVFNIIILFYIARPTMNVVVGTVNPDSKHLDQYKHIQVQSTNGAKSYISKTIAKEKFIVKGPLKVVRHLALKTESHGLENRSTSYGRNMVPQGNIKMNGDDIMKPLMDNLVINRISRKNQDELNFRYLINPTNMCQSELYLLITVCSAVERVHHRKAIRETWGTVVRKTHLGVKIVFVIGATSDQNSHYGKNIQSESEEFGDILQIDHVDHSRNLSFKTLGLLRWVQDHCKNTSFVMKTDDDIFINTRDLLKEVKNLDTRSKVIMGHVIKGAQPITDRNDPWYNPPELYKDKTYPDYISGSAYLLPFPVIPLLLNSSRTNPVFWLEDIYFTGMLSKAAKVSLLNNSNFIFIRPEIMFDFCKYSKIQVIHGISPDEIRKLWKAVNNLNC